MAQSRRREPATATYERALCRLATPRQARLSPSQRPPSRIPTAASMDPFAEPAHVNRAAPSAKQPATSAEHAQSVGPYGQVMAVQRSNEGDWFSFIPKPRVDAASARRE